MRLVILVSILAVSACVSPALVPYMTAKGAYQTFEGTTSDGRRFTGTSWVDFSNTDGTGRFCARVSGKYSCTGTYDATDEALILPGRFTCTGGVTGRSRTERVYDRDLQTIIGVRGTARMSDRTTATYTLGPSRPWNGESLCS